MKRLLLLILGLYLLSACTSGLGGLPMGGEIDTTPECADVTFEVAPAAEYQCSGTSIEVTWDAPNLPADCVPELGRGCIEPPDGLGPVCTDVWTETTDLTTPRLRGSGCTVERRAAGDCIFCRQPASGSETLSPTGDISVRYVSSRVFGNGTRRECYGQKRIRIVSTTNTRPHPESFNYDCDTNGSGFWARKEWVAGEFATSDIRIDSVMNISSVSVHVSLERVNESTGLPETYMTETPVRPGGLLPEVFNGAAEGRWLVTPEPADVFEPAECPSPPPPPGTVRDNPIPFDPIRVPPPLTLMFQLECTQG